MRTTTPMTIWTQRVEGHPVHQTLSSLLALVREAQASAATTPDSLDAANRLAHVLEMCEFSLDAADPDLTMPQTLDGMRQWLNEIASNLANYRANGSPSHLTQANAYADNLLPLLAQLPRGVEGKSGAKAGLSIRQLRTQTEDAFAKLRGRADAFESLLDELTVRLRSLGEAAETQNTRFDAAIARFEEQFSRAEEIRRTQFDDNVLGASEALINVKEDLRESVKREVSAAKARFENAQGDLLASGQGILKILEARRDEATKIVGIISESGMIKGFRSVADQERVSAKNWQQLATWSMIALAVFAFFAFAESFYRPFTWAILSSRVFVALTVGLLIAYAARQADRHENAERQSRRQELELAALDPFLLPLPEADRNAVKKAMAEKMFGRREDPLTAPEPKEFSGSMLEVMKLLAESAKEAIQKR